MHAKRRHCGRGFRSIDVVNKDHRIAFVGSALATRGYAGATTDAALWIDEHRLFHQLTPLHFAE